MIKAGTKIFNPDGSGGYEITDDIHPHDTLRYSLFKPFGKSPTPAAGKIIPAWLMYELDKYAKKEGK